MATRLYSPEDLTEIRRRVMVRSLELYEAAGRAKNTGHVWYYEANSLARRLADIAEVSMERAAGVLAVLSPQIDWGDCVVEAHKVIWGDVDGYHALPENVAKAYRVLHDPGNYADNIRGKKVRAFWTNIMGPDVAGVVTLDTHMSRMYSIPTRHLFEAVGVYEAAEAGVCDAANELDVLGHQIQATLWIAYKTHRGGRLVGPTEEAF